ncbi:hypothetical protein F4778DRAFT_782416 [Xylariomycetidae sp. FL2044]|nr:hypothetical protein F4778DRAFT_782416 [Xylariomycetidae sp. FL2044]
MTADPRTATVKDDLEPTLHDVRYEATLKYNSSHQLYRPLTEPAYVGSPSPEIDAEWERLVGAVEIFVTPEEQELLGGDLFMDEETGLYIAENFIRKSLYPDYYHKMTSHETWRPHLEHCLDAVRLSLMCAGDMTLIPVKWSENRSWIMPIFETVHTCRDFDALRAWAFARDATNDDTFRENAARLREKAQMMDPHDAEPVREHRDWATTMGP